MTIQAVRHNPYIAGNALRNQRGFVGRADVLQLVSSLLTSPNQSALVLFGQRRIGKTSILLQLHRRLATPLFLPVYFDLMDRARRSLGLVLYELAATIAAEAQLPGPDRALFDDAGTYFRRTFLPQLYAALGPARNPVLLLDEFDVLDAAAEERLAETSAAHAFFPYLRELLQGEPRLRFIFVVGRRAEDLSINVKATFKAALYQRVSVLDAESAKRLITTAERDGTLSFAPEAVERILTLTAGHPYFIQLICQLAWDSAHAQSKSGPPLVTLPLVEQAAARALEAGQNVFEWIWDGLPPAERVIFSAIAAATQEGTLVSEEQLTSLLQSHGVRILTRDLELAPGTLVQWEMLRQAGSAPPTYRFFSELMRRWVETNKPLPTVKNELDRIVPLAETLYRSADGFYRQRDLPNAEFQLRQALRVNPNHLKARLLLGQTLLELERADEAIRELEEAYRIDEHAGRLRLVEALLLRAAEHERANADDEALKAFDRTLELSPREVKAQEGHNAIWRRRAEAALKGGDLEAAALAFRQAGDEARASESNTLARHRQIDALRQHAIAAEQQEAWDDAAASYARLAALDPHTVHWQEGVTRTKASRRAQLAYQRAETAVKALNLIEAILAADEALYIRPAYREAADLRAQAFEALGKQAKQHEQREEWTEALGIYQPLAEKRPDDTRIQHEVARLAAERELNARYAAGAVALRQRDWTHAAQQFAAVVQARPAYKDAAKLLERAERGKQGKTISIPRWAIALLTLVVSVLLIGGGVTAYYFPTWFPSTAEQYYERGLARKSAGSYDLAIADFTQAIALDPSYGEAYEKRGETYQRREQYELAINDYTSAIDLTPDSAYLYFTRGQAYLDWGQTDAAIADFRKTYEFDHDYYRQAAAEELAKLGVTP
jgi:tetratricopeptide (TPR) repeat protein